MALGTRKQRVRQEPLWIAQAGVAGLGRSPFYTRLNELLGAEKFDEFDDAACQQFYANKLGRPSLTRASPSALSWSAISRASILNAVSLGGPPIRSASATFRALDSTNAAPISRPFRAPAG